MKPKWIKREEAAERQAKHDALTPKQKLAKLDEKFGKGQGAKKEREKLAALIKHQDKPKRK